jgi:DNA-binding MarR family transcriptional regulator
MAKWRFLTNHALVLIHVFEHPRSTLREIADAVGITDRAALAILRQMEEDNCVSRQKVGRRIHYTVNLRAVLADRMEGRYRVRDLIWALARLLGGLDREDDPGAGIPVS